ncbi:MAG: hypothetical protein L3J78_03740 [Thermoplasmata archaeon]|nr:hypothetical protein [Thermoplasmata archaeon]
MAMPGTLSAKLKVGRGIAMAVIWTIVFVLGLGLGLLVGIQGLADLVQRASTSTTEARTAVVAVATAMVLTGIYGIMATHRNLRHSVDLIAEVDRARNETMAQESARYAQRPK